MTNQLYYQDQYKVKFSSRIKEVVPEGKIFRLYLDVTCFYPEGGGQPADKGWLSGIPVLDVKKTLQGVAHYVSQIPEGEEVSGEIDWNHRYYYMVQHSGQHLVSAVLYHLKGWNTVSVHFGEKDTTIELDIAELSEEEAWEVEEEANRLIRQGLPLDSSWITEKDLEGLELRREPTVSGSIRVVSLKGYDSTPCGGIHVSDTSQIKTTLWLGNEKIRGHVRTHWLFGDPAVAFYRENLKTLKSLSILLSSPLEKLLEAAEIQKNQLTEAVGRQVFYRDQAATAWAEYLLLTLREDGQRKALVFEFQNQDKGFIRQVAERIIKIVDTPLALVNRLDNSLEWLITVKFPEFPFNKHKERLLNPICGRGGGKSPFWQGAGDNQGGTGQFFNEFIKIIEEYSL